MLEVLSLDPHEAASPGPSYPSYPRIKGEEYKGAYEGKMKVDDLTPIEQLQALLFLLGGDVSRCREGVMNKNSTQGCCCDVTTGNRCWKAATMIVCNLEKPTVFSLPSRSLGEATAVAGLSRYIRSTSSCFY